MHFQSFLVGGSSLKRYHNGFTGDRHSLDGGGNLNVGRYARSTLQANFRVETLYVDTMLSLTEMFV